MEDATEDRPSKTRRKRAMHELQSLGEALVELSRERLEEVAIPQALLEAVLAAKTITRHEARRRQMQFIGRLMREVDAEPIRAKLDEFSGRSVAATRALHEAERWRLRLIEDDNALTEFARVHALADLQELRTSVREARKEQAARSAGLDARGGRHFRELFRLVKRTLEPQGSEVDHE